MGRFKSLFFSIFLLKRAILHFWHGKTNNNLFQQLVELNRELDCGKFNHSNGPESPWNCLLPANVPRRLSHGPIQFGSSRLPLCCRSTTTKNSSLLPTFPIHESHIILGEVYFSKERFYLIGFWEIFHFINSWDITQFLANNEVSIVYFDIFILDIQRDWESSTNPKLNF